MLHYARLAWTPLLFGAATEEQLHSYPEKQGSHMPHVRRLRNTPTANIGSPSEVWAHILSSLFKAINKHVTDPSSQNKLDAFWCQPEGRNKFLNFFANIQEYLTNFS